MRAHPTNTRRGAALIIALAIMVLVLALVVGILSRVSTERSSAGGYASSVGARLLADTAVQLVQAQIDAGASGGTTIAWASQPGLIRTFDNSGKPLKSLKLYSAKDMQATGALDPAIEAAELAEWYKTPAVFTDINMPVDTNFDGTPDTWPILDPAAAGVVEGFAINAPPKGKYLGIENAAPMPVRWLYILQDGQVVAAVASGSGVAVDAATKDNPIVGRIAFWTDDETCKVNVNTASEGTYWDVPKAKSPTEIDFGKFQPTKNEFQTYPGHPATTSLSAVFPDLSYDQIMDITPRIKKGGSEDATVIVQNAKAVTLDKDRLYATEDELLFTGARSENAGMTKGLLERSKFFVTTTSRAPETNLFNLPRVAAWPIHATDSTLFRTPFDRLIAFCSTLNGQPYYFQRRNAASTTDDYATIDRNKKLFSYLRKLGTERIPGFGGTMSGKYGADHDQILTEMFDYIRCTNLADGNLLLANRYAGGKLVNGSAGKYFGSGEVMPIKIEDASASPAISTRGFGRIPTLTEFGFWLICTADSKDSTTNNPEKNLTLNSGTSGKLTFDDTKMTKQIRIEGAFVFEPFIPLAGYQNIHPDIEITISGLEGWTIKGNATGDTSQSLGFPALAQQTSDQRGRYLLSTSMTTAGADSPTAGHVGVWAALGQRGLAKRNHERLPQDSVFGKPFGNNGAVLNQQYPFVGEPITVDVMQASASLEIQTAPLEVKIIQRTTGEVLQTYNIDIPSGAIPAPTLQWIRGKLPADPPILKHSLQASGNGNGFPGRFEDASGFVFQEYDTAGVHTVLSDVVRTVVPVYKKDGANQSADLRLIAMKESVASSDFYQHPLYNDPATQFRVVNSFTQQGSSWYYHFARRVSEHPVAVAKLPRSLADIPENYNQQGRPDTSWAVQDANLTGDWDNGIVGQIDGPYLNKPDEGVTWTNASHLIPYFNSSEKDDFDAGTFFSPNRMIPSPGMFGSLPTGVKRDRHWQTLLFRRQPGHPEYQAAAGEFVNNPDYLFLDLFWMPVVEPYAISEPLSTAGKVNLNQQIIPFTWIERTTGLHAVLKNEKVMAIPNGDAAIYKSTSTNNYRRAVNVADTIKQLQFRFTDSDKTGLFAFRSATEICDQHIIPDDASVSVDTKAGLDSAMKAYWAAHALTGDNSRERIYTTVYPRLTTKSNTYTVYFRAQSLKKQPGSDSKIWEEAKDTVTGDYRGSTTLERYVDPGNSSIPDYASNSEATPTLDSLYKWRVRSHRPFAP